MKNVTVHTEEELTLENLHIKVTRSSRDMRKDITITKLNNSISLTESELKTLWTTLEQFKATGTIYGDHVRMEHG